MHNIIYFSDKTDPYFNLAVEETLFATGKEDTIFYLWQNQNTVVIGKNQNAWKECRFNLLEQEKGKLARRCSGGGAVFHDLGNLNFTFITPKEKYDVKKQLSVIQKAASIYKIETAFTGRNDLEEVKSGAKFSGNAFMLTDKKALHHGTILVSVDMQKMTRYLAPSPDKLKSKGVKSVRSRVINLCDVNPKISVQGMRDALVDAFISIYGPAKLGQINSLPQQEIKNKKAMLESWEWRVGRDPGFDIMMETRFPWGGFELQLNLKKGHIEEAFVYSDAMDESFIENIAKLFLGAPFNSNRLYNLLIEINNEKAHDIANWIVEKGF